MTHRIVRESEDSINNACTLTATAIPSLLGNAFCVKGVSKLFIASIHTSWWLLRRAQDLRVESNNKYFRSYVVLESDCVVTEFIRFWWSKSSMYLYLLSTLPSSSHQANWRTCLQYNEHNFACKVLLVIRRTTFPLSLGVSPARLRNFENYTILFSFHKSFILPTANVFAHWLCWGWFFYWGKLT